MKKEIMQAIKEDRLYDFIANNYYKIDREETRDLILELIYFVYEENKKILNRQIIKNLKESRGWEE